VELLIKKKIIDCWQCDAFAFSFPSFSLQPNRTLAFSEKISFPAELVLLDDKVK
jgi:hypothetical protein